MERVGRATWPVRTADVITRNFIFAALVRLDHFKRSSSTFELQAEDVA